MQHLLKDLLKESRRLISFAGVNSNKTKALFRFCLSTALQIGSLEEVLSDQLIRWCCIDRLSWHVLSECGRGAMSDLFMLAGATEFLFCCIQGMAAGRSQWVMRADKCRGQQGIAFYRGFVSLPPRPQCCMQSVSFRLLP
jgi:hypothetical protein